MARRVEDLGLILPIIAGPDWQDASVIPMPLGDWRAVHVAGLHCAFYTRHADGEPDPACIAAVHAAAAALEAAGLHVEAVLLLRLEEVYPITRDYCRRPESDRWDEWSPDGDFVLTSEEIERHLFQWDCFRRSMLGFIARYDVILTPAAELPAQPRGESEGRIDYTLTYSLTGYPCVVAAPGTTASSMPVGVQVVAQPWREDVRLAVVRVIEEVCGGVAPTGLVTGSQVCGNSAPTSLC